MLIRSLYFDQASIIAAVVCSLIIAGLLRGSAILRTEHGKAGRAGYRRRTAGLWPWVSTRPDAP